MGWWVRMTVESCLLRRVSRDCSSASGLARPIHDSVALRDSAQHWFGCAKWHPNKVQPWCIGMKLCKPMRPSRWPRAVFRSVLLRSVSGCSFGLHDLGASAYVSPHMNQRLRRYSQLGLRAFRIASSTLALVALLRSDWVTGAGAALYRFNWWWLLGLVGMI